MAEQSNTSHFCPWTHHVNSSTMYCVLFKLKFQICFRTWPTLSVINFGWCCSTMKEEYIWWISTSGFIHTCWIAENIWLKKYSCISTWEQNFSFAAKIFLMMAEQSWTHSTFYLGHNSISTIVFISARTSALLLPEANILFYWARYFHCMQGFAICCSVAKHTWRK